MTYHYASNVRLSMKRLIPFQSVDRLQFSKPALRIVLRCMNEGERESAGERAQISFCPCIYPGGRHFGPSWPAFAPAMSPLKYFSKAETSGWCTLSSHIHVRCDI